MLSGQLFIAVTMFLFTVRWQGPRSFDTTQAWKQTSGDPSGRTVHYCGVTLLYSFTIALLYVVWGVVSHSG